MIDIRSSSTTNFVARGGGIRCGIVAAGALMLVGCVAPQPAPPPPQATAQPARVADANNPPTPNPVVLRDVQSGVKQRITDFWAVNPDCSSMGYVKINIVMQPTQGMAIVERGEAFPRFNSENVRAVCNTRKVPAMLLFYQSEPGFTGNDSVAIEAIGPQGALRRVTYAIAVH